MIVYWYRVILSLFFWYQKILLIYLLLGATWITNSTLFVAEFMKIMVDYWITFHKLLFYRHNLCPLSCLTFSFMFLFDKKPHLGKYIAIYYNKRLNNNLQSSSILLQYKLQLFPPLKKFLKWNMYMWWGNSNVFQKCLYLCCHISLESKYLGTYTLKKQLCF